MGFHYCCKCETLTLNRGDERTGDRYCLDCFNYEFPPSRGTSECSGASTPAAEEVSPPSRRPSGAAATQDPSFMSGVIGSDPIGLHTDLPKSQDRRYDFGPTWKMQLCCKCETITLNRGDQQTGARYCLDCFNYEF